MMSSKRLEEMKRLVDQAQFGDVKPSAPVLAHALKDAVAEIEEIQKRIKTLEERLEQANESIDHGA